MPRMSHSTVALIASGIALAGFLSFSPARAQYDAGGAAAVSGQPSGNPVLAQVKDTLQRYGSIHTHSRYGEVWIPSASVVGQGWMPYPACHWVYDRQQSAWTYQDPTEWGQIVHHHGRWAYDQQAGWMWIADGHYGPGHVHWKTENGQVSWAALSPEIDGGGPTEGWQNQDQATFGAGCRTPSAAPLASVPPPAPPPAYGRPAAPSPAYAAPSAPSYAPPPAYPRPAYAPLPAYGTGPRPVAIPVSPPPPIRVVVVPPPTFPPGQTHCRRFPHSPGCIPDATVNICKRRPELPFCQTKPQTTSVFCQKNPQVPMCKPGGGNGGIAAGLCATNPDLPNCKKKFALDKSAKPFGKFGGLQRPFRPAFQRPGFQKLPKFSFRPQMARPNAVRPSLKLPQRNVFRPTFQPRPAMAARPGHQNRGFGGGFRGGFGAGSGGGFRFAGGGGRRR